MTRDQDGKGVLFKSLTDGPGSAVIPASSRKFTVRHSLAGFGFAQTRVNVPLKLAEGSGPQHLEWHFNSLEELVPNDVAQGIGDISGGRNGKVGEFSVRPDRAKTTSSYG